MFARLFLLTLAHDVVVNQDEDEQRAPDNLAVEVGDALVHVEPTRDHLHDEDGDDNALHIALSAIGIDTAKHRDKDRLHDVGGTVAELNRPSMMIPAAALRRPLSI